MNATGELLTLTRVFLSLLFVIALTFIAAKLARRAGMHGNGQNIRVLERVPLNREASLAVVRVADKALVLGVTAHQINIVTEFSPGQADELYPSSESGAGSVRVRRLPPGAAARTDLDMSARTQGTGSVLDPRTWRQGITALRDLTTRRNG